MKIYGMIKDEMKNKFLKENPDWKPYRKVRVKKTLEEMKENEMKNKANWLKRNKEKVKDYNNWYYRNIRK